MSMKSFQVNHKVSQIALYKRKLRQLRKNEVKVDYEKMKVSELRKLATAKGIVWRHAYGRNKHLLKADLILALSKA